MDGLFDDGAVMANHPAVDVSVLALQRHLATIIDAVKEASEARDEAIRLASESRDNAQDAAVATALIAHDNHVELLVNGLLRHAEDAKVANDTELRERDRRYGQRFEAQEAALTEARSVNDLALAAALQSVKDVAAEQDRRYGQRFEAQEAALTEARSVNDLALAAALQSVKDVAAEQDLRYEQRFDAQEKAVELALSRVDKEFHEHVQQAREEARTALSATERAVQQALDAASRAIDKSEMATEKRFESVNGLQAQLRDQASRFMPRSEAEQMGKSNADKIEALAQRVREDLATIDARLVSTNSRLDKTAGGTEGADKFRTGMFALIVTAATAIGVIVTITSS